MLQDMIFRRLGSFKPGATVATHLLVAALLWSLIGIYLAVRGVLLLDRGQGWLLVPAVAVGFGKARLVLDRAAGANIARIAGRAEDICLGGVYSWRMWGFVVLMMLLGRLLRHSGLAGWLVGLVYVAVGTALCWSGRLFWRQWLATRSS